MKRVAILAGIPGTGKTTIARKLISLYKDLEYKKIRPLVDGMVNDDVIILGDYRDPNKVFSGCDTWSMSVQPESDAFFFENERNVFFEGDRILNNKTLENVQRLGYEVLLLIVEVDPEEVERRYKERGSEQSEKFITGRRTKIRNLTENPNYSSIIRFTPHDNSKDTERVAKGLLQFLETGDLDPSFDQRQRETLDDLFS